MKALERLRSAIGRKTDLDPFVLYQDVIDNFFDDKLDIIGDILKHESDPLILGQIMIDRLKETISEAIREAETGDPDESRENRRLFDRGEAVGLRKIA